MPAPLEIVAAPFEVYIGPVGESFPDTDETPAGNWVLIGTSGSLNITEDGVTVEHSQTIETFRALGSTGPRKAFRTQEDMIVRFTLADLTLENYKYALNYNTVTDVAAASGVPGYRHINSYQGLTVDTRALLIRGINASPYQEGAEIQYEVPVCFENGSKEVTGQKGTPVGLALEYMALEDPNAASEGVRFGRILMQDADAS